MAQPPLEVTTATTEVLEQQPQHRRCLSAVCNHVGCFASYSRKREWLLHQSSVLLSVVVAVVGQQPQCGMEKVVPIAQYLSFPVDEYGQWQSVHRTLVVHLSSVSAEVAAVE